MAGTSKLVISQGVKLLTFSKISLPVVEATEVQTPSANSNSSTTNENNKLQANQK